MRRYSVLQPAAEHGRWSILVEVCDIGVPLLKYPGHGRTGAVRLSLTVVGFWASEIVYGGSYFGAQPDVQDVMQPDLLEVFQSPPRGGSFVV